MIASSLEGRYAQSAAALSVAQQYIQAFDKLAKTNNTVIIPNNVGDISSFVAQAMSIYKHVSADTYPRNQQNVSKEQSQYEIEGSDDTYEYFSDKDEAESYKKKERNKQSPKSV